jgi:hypothetical protein
MYVLGTPIKQGCYAQDWSNRRDQAKSKNLWSKYGNFNFIFLEKWQLWHICFLKNKSFAQVVVPFFCHQVVKFHHKKDISWYELEMKVCKDLGVQVSRFPNNRGYIYT